MLHIPLLSIESVGDACDLVTLFICRLWTPAALVRFKTLPPLLHTECASAQSQPSPCLTNLVCYNFSDSIKMATHKVHSAYPTRTALSTLQGLGKSRAAHAMTR